MVGLPARGKTHMARKLVRYLSFFHGADARVFNVGHYRRQRVGRDAPPDFFDPGNAANVATRQECAEEAMREMKAFLFHDREQQALIDQDGDQDRLKGPKGVYSGLVGVFDATNSTRERRAWISQELAGLPVKLIFVESICTLEDVIEQNIRDPRRFRRTTSTWPTRRRPSSTSAAAWTSTSRPTRPWGPLGRRSPSSPG